MKRGFGNKKVAKGAPSGLMVSLVIHAGIIVAAIFVTVFTIIEKKEHVFVPDPVPVRPRIKPPKPRVRISKNPKPQASSRLVAHVPRERMPKFSLPDLPGNGDGFLNDSVPGFIPTIPIDLPQTALTDPQAPDTGNSLIVNYYNLNRRRNGTKRNISHEEYFAILSDFVDSGWDVTKLAKFYRSPTRLHATTIMIPITSSTLGPAAFGEDVNEGFCWVVHYKGKLVHKKGLTFRFWGAADDVLTVRVGGKVVLAANFSWEGVHAYRIAGDWASRAPNNRAFRLGNQKMVGGDWITLEPGIPVDMEAIAGEGPGGEFHAQLLVEVKGEEYPINDRGAPIFPIFAMEKPTWALQDSILENLFEGEANVTNVTTIFSDF